MTQEAQAPGQAAAAPQAPTKADRTSVIGSWGPRIVLIAVGAVTLISIGFVLFGASGDAIGRIVFTDLALIAFGLLVWLDAIIGRYRPDWFEVASMAADAYLLLLWIGIIWLGEPGPVDLLLGIYVFAVVRFALLHIDLVRWMTTRWASTVNRIIGGIAVASISLFFILLTLPCLEFMARAWELDFYGRIVAALAILGSMSTIMIPLTALLYNRKPKNLTPAAPAGYGTPGYGAAGYGAAGYGAQAPGQAAPYGASAYGGPVPVPGNPYGVPAPAAPAPAPAGQFGQQPTNFGFVAGAGQPSPTSAPDEAPDASGEDAAAALTNESDSADFGDTVTRTKSSSASSATGEASDAAAPAAAPGSIGAPPAAPVGQVRAWPRLADGTPLPVSPTGAPDFAAVRPGQQLAWPTYADGTPVPANPDGSPVAG